MLSKKTYMIIIKVHISTAVDRKIILVLYHYKILSKVNTYTTYFSNNSIYTNFLVHDEKIIKYVIEFKTY